MTKVTIDTEDIDILLIGNKEEVKEGIRLIDEHFRENIAGIIRQVALSANCHDLRDIYQEVMTSILECARNGKYNSDAQTLKSFIFIIARRRAVDWLRVKGRVKEEYDTDQIVESTKEIICGSKYNEPWQIAQSEEKRNLILSTIRKLASRSNLRQRQVAEIIVENFPNPLSISEIKDQILKRYGEEVTTIAIKRARQEVREKVKASLERAGYGEYIDDE